jgi:hypothetical protein
MNEAFLGDSYDLVKRFFCHELTNLGYEVICDLQFTTDLGAREDQFLRLIGAGKRAESTSGSRRIALFLDPNTGVRSKNGAHHATFDTVISRAADHAVVFAFDQSYVRQSKEGQKRAIDSKLKVLADRGCCAMIYDSHARFLFVSKNADSLAQLRDHLIELGLPECRLYPLAAS